MGLRFCKSIKLAPGVRMNFSTRGAGFSVGPRGASVSVSSRGVHGNVGIPGTGLSYRQRLDAPAGLRTSARPVLPAPPASSGSLQAKVMEEGEVIFLTPAGTPIPEYLYHKLHKTYRAEVSDLLQEVCKQVNDRIEAVGEVHRGTPTPNRNPTYRPQHFETQEPQRPAMPPPGLLARIFPWLQRRAEERHRRELEAYEAAWAEWDRQHSEHQSLEIQRQRLIEIDLLADPEVMEAWLTQAYEQIDWPRETLVSFELRDGGRGVCIDVDLPEIEDMPTQQAKVPSRGKRLSLKELSATAVQRLYMRHVHGIGFRLIGEAFAHLPTVQRVVLGGYSQRRSRATGQLSDEYLYSVAVDRQAWAQLDFSRDGLEALDVVEALAQFDLRRNMSRTGVFKAVEPHQPEHYALNLQPAAPAG